MALPNPIGVLLYWGGEIRQEGGLHYEPTRANVAFMLKERIGYEELVDKIYRYMGLDRIHYRLNIILKCPCPPTMIHTQWPVTDDDSLEIIYNLNNNYTGFVAELYIEQEEIVPPPSTQVVGGMNESGPMMSLVNPFLYPQNQPHVPYPPRYYSSVMTHGMATSETVMNNVGERSHYFEAECVTSQIHQHSASRGTPVHGLESIPSTSFGSRACNSAVERLVQSEGRVVRFDSSSSDDDSNYVES